MKRKIDGMSEDDWIDLYSAMVESDALPSTHIASLITDALEPIKQRSGTVKVRGHLVGLNKNHYSVAPELQVNDLLSTLSFLPIESFLYFKNGTSSHLMNTAIQYIPKKRWLYLNTNNPEVIAFLSQNAFPKDVGLFIAENVLLANALSVSSQLPAFSSIMLGRLDHAYIQEVVRSLNKGIYISLSELSNIVNIVSVLPSEVILSICKNVPFDGINLILNAQNEHGYLSIHAALPLSSVTHIARNLKPGAHLFLTRFMSNEALVAAASHMQDGRKLILDVGMSNEQVQLVLDFLEMDVEIKSMSCQLPAPMPAIVSTDSMPTSTNMATNRYPLFSAVSSSSNFKRVSLQEERAVVTPNLPSSVMHGD